MIAGDTAAAAPGRAGVPEAGRGMERHLVWVLVSLAYLTVFPYYQRINNPNENARIWMVRAIVEHHELSINRTSQELGYVNDKVIVNGRLYSGKAPGASFVGVPIYAAQRTLARWFGLPPLSQGAITLALRLFGVSLPLTIFLFFYARYVERLTGSAAARDLLVVGLGLGTILYPYGVIFVGHALAAALCFSGFMLVSLEPARAPRRRRLAWAGALVGLSVLFEYQVGIAAAVVSLYAVARHRREAVFFVLGALPAVVLFGAYHAVVFGRPWELPFAHIENPEFARLPGQVHHPDPHVIGAVLFSVDLGLFAFSPFLLVGLAGAATLLVRGERLEGATILLVLAGMVAFLSSLPSWHAGWCVGPRYISVVAPFLCAGIAYAWRRTRRVFLLSALTAGLVIPSVLLNVVSGAVYPHYPEAFNNPVFDLTLPLLGDGFVPYSLGWLLRLPGLWSLAPLAMLVLAALAPGVAGEQTRPRGWLAHAGLAVLVAAAFLLPLSRYGRAPRADEAHATALVRSTWAPPPRR
jgi:hypothetical protein